MPYNTSLDEQVFSKFIDTGNGKITVSVFSYNKGPKKLQIVREVNTSDGTSKFTRLGRLAKNELENLLPLIQEAIAKM